MQSNLLFSSSAKPSIDLISRSVVAIISLITVGLVQQPQLQLSVFLAFLSLMLVERTSLFRWGILAVFVANTFMVFLLSRYFLDHTGTILNRLSITVASITILNWYGGTISWPAFRNQFLQKGILWDLGIFLDRGIYQGDIIIESIQKRFQAAWMRIGSKYRYPRNVGRAIGGGLALSLDRAQNIEEALSIKTKNYSKTSGCLTVSRCSVGFKNNAEVLTDISFNMTQGDWLLVAGPSGSGKTTLLRLVAGLVKPYAGFVSTDIGQVGFLFQNPDDQLFATTARQDIYWGLKENGKQHNEASRIVNYWLTELQIDHLADRPLAKLSFGEKKRVALAGTLALDPDLLLCDEPTAGLDYPAAKHLIKTLEIIAEEKSISVIWVSHDLVNLPIKISKSLLLNKGSSVFCGTLKNALTPENLVSSGLR